MVNPCLRQTCPLCVSWKQLEPNCAHGLLDGDNPGSLFFSASRALTLEIGVRAAEAMVRENVVGAVYRGEYLDSLLRRAA